MKIVGSPSLVVIALAACLAIFSSCDKTEDFSTDYKYGYFPDQIGHYVIYDVDSIVFNDFTHDVDTFRYQKKYLIDSTFLDGTGHNAFKLIRYHRADSTQGWVLTDVWWASIVNNTLEVGEENQRFVKLLFPPKEDQTWHGNKYLVDSLSGNWWFWRLGEWEYTVSEVDVPATVNGIQFDSTVTVVQQSDSTLIHRVISTEKYAKNVGMIYKQFIAMEKDGDITRPWTNPEAGFILTFRINSYGN